jgi:hypothetical protein
MYCLNYNMYSTLVLNLLLYGCENWVLTAPLR